MAAAKMAAFHQTYDLYVTPATAYSAPKVGELMHNDQEIAALLRVSSLSMQAQQDLIYEMFLKSLTYTPFTQLANLTGQPSMSVPVHLTEADMPLGVQVTAPKGKEDWYAQTGVRNRIILIMERNASITESIIQWHRR